jgi:hypothetical protein
MAHWVNGVKHPKKEDFETHSRKICKYTADFLDDDFDSADPLRTLRRVLYSANTVLNYHGQSSMGGGSKRRRESDSDSKCTPW